MKLDNNSTILLNELFSEYEKDVSFAHNNELITERIKQTRLIEGENFVKWCNGKFHPGLSNLIKNNPDKLEENKNERISMKTQRKTFVRKSNIFIPIPTKSPATIQREEETRELLSLLRNHRKRSWLCIGILNRSKY